jgi:hypothetical protein
MQCVWNFNFRILSCAVRDKACVGFILARTAVVLCQFVTNSIDILVSLRHTRGCRLSKLGVWVIWEGFVWELSDVADNIAVQTVSAFTLHMAKATGIMY